MSSPEDLRLVSLNDGHQLPGIGLGTFDMKGQDGIASILSGIEAGYRLLDTASGYGNEIEVATAIQASTVPRHEFRVTSKLRGPDHAYQRARDSIRAPRERLGGNPIDLYLIHWPNPRKGLYLEAWRALIDARAAGYVRSIGVSNFEAPHLQAIIEATEVVPAVNQIELHPYFPQPDLRALNNSLGILTQSWSPIGQGQVLDELPLVAIAADHHVTPAQVVLRWHHQLGCVPIPRSANPQRQTKNLDIASFSLTPEQMARIESLGAPDAPRHGRLWGGDPATTQL